MDVGGALSFNVRDYKRHCVFCSVVDVFWLMMMMKCKITSNIKITPVFFLMRVAHTKTDKSV